jgi:hypothetical protein
MIRAKRPWPLMAGMALGGWALPLVRIRPADSALSLAEVNRKLDSILFIKREH